MKGKVFETLIWFKKNNYLYKNIVINFNFIDTWEEESVLAGISDTILQSDEDIKKEKIML